MSPTQDDTFKFLVTSHLTRTFLGSRFLASIEVRHRQRRAWAGASSEYLPSVVTFTMGSMNHALPLSQAAWVFSARIYFFFFSFLFKRNLQGLLFKVLNVLIQQTLVNRTKGKGLT